MALLIQSCRLHGVVMNEDFVICQPKEIDMPLLDMPWQSLSMTARDIVARARTKGAPVRDTYGEVYEIDVPTLNASKQKLDTEERSIARCIATGAAWTQKATVDAGKADDHRCPHCKAPSQDMFHMLA